jgi:3-oxoadipate enol-lactonase
MRSAERGPVRIHWEQTGSGSGPCILFLNSIGSSLRMWDKVVPHFEGHYRVLRMDTRGHGASDVPACPYTLEQLGRDALSVLDRAGVVRAHVCGLSLGGQVAMWMALHAPERVSRIILANTAARIGTTALWDERIATVRNLGMNGLAEAALDRWFTPAYRDGHAEEMETVRQMISSTSPDGYIACCRVLRESDLSSAIPAIEAPALVIAGTHDPATPPEAGKSIHAALRNSGYVELGASHLSAWERPEEFAAATLEFLAQEESANG